MNHRNFKANMLFLFNYLNYNSDAARHVSHFPP